MLPLLTKYLVHYKSVCIPGVGTFDLQQQAPQLDVADKLVIPPYFITRFSSQDSISDHQFHFFSKEAGIDREILRQELSAFGDRLRSNIRRQPFQWNGFGTIYYDAGGIKFEPAQINLSSLGKVNAQKVMRENAQHSIRVGDHEVLTSHDNNPVVVPAPSRRHWYVVAGWILLGLAVVCIGFLLYKGGFQPGSSGLRIKI